MWILLVIAAVLSAWLCFLMISQSGYYEERAEDLHERERVIKAARGRILDRNGVVLADNQLVCTVTVIHNQITDPERVIKVLSETLKLDEAFVRERVEKVSSIEKIRSNVPKSVGMKSAAISWMASMLMKIMPGIIHTVSWPRRFLALPVLTTRELSGWRLSMMNILPVQRVRY